MVIVLTARSIAVIFNRGSAEHLPRVPQLASKK